MRWTSFLIACAGQIFFNRARFAMGTKLTFVLSEGLEIEDRFQECHVVVDRIENLNSCSTDRRDSAFRKVNLGNGTGFVLGNALRDFVDLVRDFGWGWLAIFAIELDAKVPVHTRGVMRGRQDKSTKGNKATFACADNSTHGRGAQQPVLPNPDLRNAVGNGHGQDNLQRVLVEVSAITANNHDATLHLAATAYQGIESALHIILQIVLALEDLHRLTQARSSRLLACDWGSWHSLHRKALHVAPRDGDQSSSQKLDEVFKIKNEKHLLLLHDLQQSLDARFV